MKKYIQLEIPFDIEVWRPVVGYEDLYEVSNLGRVKSLGNGKTNKKIKVLKPGYTGEYYQVALFKNGLNKRFFVHRLVALAFVPNDNPEHKTQVNHINENKLDNRANNLNWMTPKENINWGTGIKRKSKKQFKSVLQYTLDGVLVRQWNCIKDAETIGFKHQDISKCCKGKKKSHRGFLWEYA